MSKIGRNVPCPCGSGKRYKRCCLARDEAARAAAVPDEGQFKGEPRPELDEAVDRALQRLEQGEGKRVKAEITRLLKEHPDHHLTNYAMGVYQAMVEEAPAAAVRYFERAVAIFPSFPEAHFNLANAARQAMDVPKAVAGLRAAMHYAQDGGIGEMARKQLQQLDGILLKSTPFSSLDAFLANAKLFDRAFECLTRREFAQAAEFFERVLGDNPTHVQSHGNLALAYAGLGRRADALASFDRALALDPSYEPAILNRRKISEMREGEPFLPDMASVEYYADRIRSERRAAGSDAAGG